jgi:hypothetical protein
MTEFEDQLRRALERKEPSADFTARVMARATQSKRPLAWVSWRVNWRPWAAIGVAASLCLGALGLEMEHRRRERVQGEAARAQLIQAMRITSAKLQHIHKRVQGTL